MLKYLQSFSVLAEELHFNKAATRLHLTQPALTYQIKKLEKQVGCSLFKRSPQKVELTEAGVVLARELGVALKHVNVAVKMAQDVALAESGSLVVGYCELPRSGNMAEVIRRFAGLHPNITISLLNIRTIEQPDALEKGIIDVGFLHPPLDAPKLVMRPAGEEDMIIAIRADHRLAKKADVSMLDLALETLIVPAERLGPFMFKQITEACQTSGFKPKFREELFRWHSMLDQVASGLGVAIVPESLASADPLLVFKHVPDLKVKLSTAIATTCEPLRPAVLRFLAAAH